MSRAALTILGRDLSLELRARESVPAMALFSVSVFVLFHFALDRDAIDGGLAAGTLWVTLLLASVLAISRLFAAERDGGAMDQLLLAPIDRTAIWLAKAGVLFVYLVAVELVALPAFALLLLGPALLPALPALAATLLVADLAVAAAGALVAALAAESRVRELVSALLFLPLAVPVAAAGASASEPLFTGAQAPEDLGRWLGFLAIYTLVFALLSVATFDYLLED